jgi:hypothetical protein
VSFAVATRTAHISDGDGPSLVNARSSASPHARNNAVFAAVGVELKGVS